uniref:Uncharacterized protein n=1 Tax=Utricularia reniformis TaxID=192314 RepID=A0A1Y0AZ01_9LAMI|nr:hypothetical protein AEK19_MT1667 [Utricularia reniformis]ART30396.1 hypothetical protein AEK19_MT1667 [Utricularia reniformis]
MDGWLDRKERLQLRDRLSYRRGFFCTVHARGTLVLLSECGLVPSVVHRKNEGVSLCFDFFFWIRVSDSSFCFFCSLVWAEDGSEVPRN